MDIMNENERRLQMKKDELTNKLHAKIWENIKLIIERMTKEDIEKLTDENKLLDYFQIKFIKHNYTESSLKKLLKENYENIFANSFEQNSPSTQKKVDLPASKTYKDFTQLLSEKGNEVLAALTRDEKFLNYDKQEIKENFANYVKNYCNVTKAPETRQNLTSEEKLMQVMKQSRRTVHHLDIHLRKRDSSTPMGIKNTGNSCYISSILQILFYSNSFLKKIFNFRKSTEEKNKEQDIRAKKQNEKDSMQRRKAEEQGADLVQGLQNMFGMMVKGESLVVDPSELFKKLVDPVTGENFVSGHQKDVTEFLDFFFKLLGAGFRKNKKVVF